MKKCHNFLVAIISVSTFLAPVGHIVNAQEEMSDSDHPSLAIALPNFQPNMYFRDNSLILEIPASILEAGLHPILRASEGRVKDTEFQRINISNLRISLVNELYDGCGNRPNCIHSGQRTNHSGIRVNGSWQFQFRERLVYNPITGRWTHTRWSSVSGTFSQPLYFSVNENSQVRLSAGGLTLRGSRWYSDVVTHIANLFDVQSTVRQNVQNELNSINGLNLRTLIINQGSSVISQQLGVSQRQASDLLQQRLGRLDLNVSSNNLIISAHSPISRSDFNIVERPEDRPPVSTTLNFNGNPLYGTVQLRAGFTPDPFNVNVVAGGRTDVERLRLGQNCVGFVTADQPDFRVMYTAGGYPLSFFVESTADTTLIINDPSGAWHCNDDFNGVNPRVTLSQPISGQYDIWVGNYGNTSTSQATLYVTELSR